jgi:hypothetical protein
MLQASAQAVDFKVGRYFGEGQGTESQRSLAVGQRAACSSFDIGELSTEQELAQFDLIG